MSIESPRGTLQAIETRYKGYRFRSRLEARWGVYFDSLGVRWFYEAEGFKLPDGTFYLPDFWLPDLDVFAEVKPRTFSREEFEKCSALDLACLLLDGAPEPRLYFLAGNPLQPDGNLLYPEGDEALTTYARYLANINYDRVDLGRSRSEGQLWHSFGEEAASAEIEDAIMASRGARFEHGERQR